jgi:UDP-N-acetylmuramate--alanine ligase
MNKHYHFIGIGGIGMSGIAQLMLERRMRVSGSDLKASHITDELKVKGASIFIGHDAENIQGADEVIYSSAIKEDNPEIQEAKRLGVPLVRRAQALAELMQGETVITVTGSHGKTTTTSLVSYLLMQAGLCPTAAIGGILKNIENNACLGKGTFFVAEADESDGSFLYYQPKYSIITNIDYEHLDYYKDFQNQVNTFKEFIYRTKEDGCLFCCADDVNLKNILKDYKNRYVLFGLKDDADIYPKNIEIKGLSSEFDCYYKNKFLQRFHLSLGGRHNISNALAVVALGLELKIDLNFIREALSGYKGALRRIETKYNANGYLVFDDYAHHPTEIKATLAAVRNLKFDRLIAAFQPHRYTRTKLLFDEFARSFALADYVILTDIYPASEQALEGVTSALIYDKMRQYYPAKEIELLPKEQISGHVLGILRPGDLFITLGAGDISKVGDELVEGLKRKSQAG